MPLPLITLQERQPLRRDEPRPSQLAAAAMRPERRHLLYAGVVDDDLLYEFRGRCFSRILARTGWLLREAGLA
jgi:hypothetical protein